MLAKVALNLYGYKVVCPVSLGSVSNASLVGALDDGAGSSAPDSMALGASSRTLPLDVWSGGIHKGSQVFLH